MNASARVLALLCSCIALKTAFAGEASTRIWIDTDAACGAGLLKDVDDCLAIAMLLSNPKWDVIGISSVYGNAPLTTTDRTVRSLVGDWCDHCIPVYRGADQPGTDPTLAAEALAAALQREPLVVFILGPATNVSAALHTPETLNHEHRFVAVAGTRERRSRLTVSKYSPFRLRDLNFVSDPDAFKYLLTRNLNLSLAPFELAKQVRFRPRHIKRLAHHFPRLAAQSRRWLWLWRAVFGVNGFHPFDAVAVGILFSDKGGFTCSAGNATVVEQSSQTEWRRAILHVQLNTTESNVTYCHKVASGYADIMLDQFNEPSKQSSRFLSSSVGKPAHLF